jgi:signal transduction histidine kinase
VYQIVGCLVVVTLGAAWSLYHVQMRALADSLATSERRQVEYTYHVVDTLVRRESDRLLTLSRLFAQDQIMVEAVTRASGDRDDVGELERYMSHLFAELDVDYFYVTDLQQRVLYRAHASDRRGDRTTDWGVYEALRGKIMPVVKETDATWRINAFGPIRSKGEIIGCVMVGLQLGDAFAKHIARAGQCDVTLWKEHAILATSLPARSRFAINDALALDVVTQKGQRYERLEPPPVACHYSLLQIVDEVFCLIVSVDAGASTALLAQKRREAILVTSIVLLVALTGGTMFAMRLVQPLRRLRRGAVDAVRSITGKSVRDAHRDEVQNLVQAFQCMMDVIARHDSERELREILLREAKLAAEAASQAKTGFLANMSHEIRTPMTAILGFTENLLEPGLSESDRLQAIHTIRRNGEHLLQIINGILDISKIEAHKLQIESVAFSPAQLIGEVHALMSIRAEERNLDFVVAYDGPVTETIRSDPTRLRQILVNLVGNAIKFTARGHVRLVTRLVTGETGGPVIRFDVIDTGAGLTPEQVALLFQPFTQADSSTTRSFGGTGLGLTISKRLAVLLGGDILVTSQLGRGSTFSVVIGTGPLDGVNMVEPALPGTKPEQLATTSGESEATKLDCRILLAEDGADNQRLITFILRKAGATVTIAENGRIAVDTVLGARAARAQHGAAEGSSSPGLETSSDKRQPPEPFDVVLMDMQMPVMDGYEATAVLRSNGYTGPIIALTAHAMAGDRDICIQAGCDDYATKPIDRTTLIDTIQKWLKRY